MSGIDVAQSKNNVLVPCQKSCCSTMMVELEQGELDHHRIWSFAWCADA